jgi:hypothetical protein
MDTYSCEICDYNTRHKANFNKHCNTQKHNKMINSHNKIQTKAIHVCEYCGNAYVYKTSLYKHKNHKCKIKQKHDEETAIQLKIKENKTTVNQQVINNYGDNINTQNNIHIHSYRDTDYSMLTDATFIHALTKGLMCGNEIIKQVHFNDLVPQNKNIQLTNLRGDFMKIMQNNKWTTVNRRTQLESLLETADDLLCEWLDTTDKQHKERHETISDRSVNQKEHILRTFKLMLYNLCSE